MQILLFAQNTCYASEQVYITITVGMNE